MSSVSTRDPWAAIRPDKLLSAEQYEALQADRSLLVEIAALVDRVNEGLAPAGEALSRIDAMIEGRNPGLFPTHRADEPASGEDEIEFARRWAGQVVR